MLNRSRDNNKEPELYFDDPRLHMTVAGRMFVRVVRFGGLTVLTALMLVLLLSSSPRFFWGGVLLGLFMLHRMIHFTKGTRPLELIAKGGRYNLAWSAAPGTMSLLESALDRSLISGEDIRLVLLKKLCFLKEVRGAFNRLEVDYHEILGEAERVFSKKFVRDKEYTLLLIKKVVSNAFKEGSQGREHYIEPHALLAGLFSIEDSDVEKLLSLFSLDAAEIRTALVFSHKHHSFLSLLTRPRELGGVYAKRVRHRTMNRAWTARPTPILDRYSIDLTDLVYAGEAGFLVGHTREYERLLDVLSRPGSPAALLVGETGVGKESILRHLAYNITKDNVPPILFDKRLVALSIGNVVSGIGADEARGRLVAIVSEIISAGNVILYIPDIDILVKTSEKNILSIADTLTPTFREGLFPVIGTTTPVDYKKYIEPRDDFKAIFDVVKVEEISEEEALIYLTYTSLALEDRFRVFITLGAIKEAVTLAHKYFRDLPLPASAEDLLKEALSEAGRLEEKKVSSDFVIRIAEKRVNIPIHKVSGREAETLVHLEELIRVRYVNQSEAVSAIARALREYRSGLTRKGSPIASFLFIGPTGVGKTELSKILAELQFGSKEMMVRFDMSEFQEKGSLIRFIGSSDGAIPGALTGAIRAKPYSLILLDELEKADKDILNLFLQMLDEGRLTDGLGRLVNFQNTIIVATSNAYSEFILEALEQGKTISEIRDEIKKHLILYFKPELINRFSDVIIFESLAIDDVERVAELQLRELSDDILAAQGIVLTFTREAIEAITHLGFTKTFGARSLRRVIEENLRGELANKILLGEIAKNDNVIVKYENEKFVFYKDVGS